jgi:hypothetical protein
MAPILGPGVGRRQAERAFCRRRSVPDSVRCCRQLYHGRFFSPPAPAEGVTASSCVNPHNPDDRGISRNALIAARAVRGRRLWSACHHWPRTGSGVTVAPVSFRLENACTARRLLILVVHGSEKRRYNSAAIGYTRSGNCVIRGGKLSPGPTVFRRTVKTSSVADVPKTRTGSVPVV